MTLDKQIKSLLAILFLFPLGISAQSIEDFWPDAIAQESEFTVIDSLTTAESLAIPSEELIIPGLINVDDERSIMYDFYSRQLYAVNLEDSNHSFKELGRGHGSGPEEYRFISSIDQDINGNILVLDTELFRLLVWDSQLENRMIQLPTGGMPAEIAATDSGFILKHSSISGADYLFTSHSEDGDLVVRFHQFKDWNGMRSPLFYEGNIYSTDSKLIYASNNFGVLKAYSLDGSHHFTVEMVEPVNGLELQINQSGNAVSSFREPASIFTAVDLAAENDVIYILFSGNQQLNSNRIDAYSLDDGMYLGSYILDQQVIKMSVNEGQIFAIQQDEDDEDYDQMILVYDLPLASR